MTESSGTHYFHPGDQIMGACMTCGHAKQHSNHITHPEAQGNKDLGEPDEALTDAATVQALEGL